jgi:spermidine synthase
VYDSECLGRILVLDRVIQIASKRFEDDNYTRDMVEIVVKADKDYDHVVIIGGGDLVIATHLLREYPKIRKVTVCEIDSRVVEVTKRYFSFAEIVD